jgi:hypothetical protein
MKTPDKNTQISVYCIQHYCKYSFGIIKQLLPALAAGSWFSSGTPISSSNTIPTRKV